MNAEWNPSLRKIEPTPASRRVRPFLLGLTSALVALVVGGTAVWVVAARSHALDSSAGRLRHSSQLLTQGAETNLAAMDKLLAGIAEVAALHPWNRGLREILDRRLAETPGVRALMLIGPDGISRIATNLPDPGRPMDVSDRPYFSRHKAHEGSPLFVSGAIQSRADNRWVMVLSRAVRSADGGFRGVVAASINLERLSTQLSSTLEGPGDSVVLLDPNGVVLARAPDAEQYLGNSLAGIGVFERNRDQAAGDGIAASPVDGRRRQFAFSRSAAFPVIAVATREMETVLAEWHRFALTAATAAALVAAMVLILAALSVRQLSRLDHTLGQLAASRRDALAADRAKSAFLAGMGHEFRTPLNVVLNTCDDLLAAGRSDPRHLREGVEDVREAGRRLLLLVDDLLDLSAAEAGTINIRLEAVPVAPLLRDCAEAFASRARGGDLTLAVESGDDSLAVQADSRRLRQILTNLLSNAAKFTPAGGRVTLSAEREEDMVLLTVADTGIGMDEAELLRALTPFGRIPPERNRDEPAAGLGLPLSRRLAELQGGTLSATSIPRRGTIVTVELPLAVPESQTAAP